MSNGANDKNGQQWEISSNRRGVKCLPRLLAGQQASLPLAAVAVSTHCFTKRRFVTVMLSVPAVVRSGKPSASIVLRVVCRVVS